MEKKIKWTRIIFILGIVALVAGALDPMEGSVVIAAGSVLIFIATFIDRSRYWKIFLVSMVLILVGVFFIFFFTWLGGIGGNSKNSIWWGILMIPYPVGWLLSVVFLILRAVKKPAIQSE